jgi:hypothetical protein
MKLMGKTILSGLLVGVAAGAFTAGFASPAHAGALSYSTLAISNFQILDSGGAQYNVSDFDVLEVGNFTKAEAALNGTGTVGSHPSDVNLQCIGPSCAGIGENDFAQQGGPPFGQFSRADAQLIGAGISGVPNTPSSVTTTTVAEIQLNQASEATSGSNTGTGTRFSFSLANDDSLTFNFDADAALRAMLEQDDVIAFAGVAWSLSVLDAAGASVFEFSPNAAGPGAACSLNTSISTLDDADGLVEYNCAGAFTTTTPVLLAGQNYTLSINHESSARGEVAFGAPVPEPAAAALLGLGLLGVAVVRRRAHKA